MDATLTKILASHAAYLRGEPDGQRANLSDANLSGANLRGADLSGAELSGAYLSGANLSGANLRGADLSGANLSSAYLRGANLRGADLSGAYLSSAYLRDANLRGANLSIANLRGANLRGANLSIANLRSAYLSGADLSSAYLSSAILPTPGFERIPSPELARQIIAKAEAGNLEMASWHTCNTTHCAWGWATTLNGDAGQALEAKLGIQAAGAILFPEFAPFVNESNDCALVELKRIAASGGAVTA